MSPQLTVLPPRQLLARLSGSRSPYGMQHGSERRLLGRLLGPATMNTSHGIAEPRATRTRLGVPLAIPLPEPPTGPRAGTGGHDEVPALHAEDVGRGRGVGARRGRAAPLWTRPSSASSGGGEATSWCRAAPGSTVERADALRGGKDWCVPRRAKSASRKIAWRCTRTAPG